MKEDLSVVMKRSELGVPRDDIPLTADGVLLNGGGCPCDVIMILEAPGYSSKTRTEGVSLLFHVQQWRIQAGPWTV